MGKKWKGDFNLACFLIILSIFVFYESFNFPKMSAQFPKLISICLFILGLILLILSLYTKNQKINLSKQEINKNQSNYFITCLIILGIIFYIILINYLGYIISTILLTFFIILTFGYPRKFQALLVSIIIVFILYFVFRVLLRVPLPTWF